MRTTILALTAATLLASAPAFALDQALQSAVSAPTRSAANTARDGARHPGEELAFFGVTPSATVVELWPGDSGYWTQILAPLLHDHGTLIEANGSPTGGDVDRFFVESAPFKAMLAANPAVYGKVRTAMFGGRDLTLAPAGSVDVVLTFRNLHNWMEEGETDSLLAAIHTALKPGGILGVEDHRANTKSPQDPKAKNGYVRQDYAIATIERAGFKLVGTSEMDANPRDTADWPKGVWTLPPTYELKDVDRAKYQAIGEADNFVLKFREAVALRSPDPTSGDRTATAESKVFCFFSSEEKALLSFPTPRNTPAMQIDRGDGTKLAYTLTPGRQPTLVFLPGFMSDMAGEKATMLAAHAEALGHACLLVDYSGHGRSGGQFIAGTIGRWTEDALFLIDRLTEGPIVLVGSSMGGWIALLVARARPDRMAGLLGIAAAPDFTETLMWAALDAPARARLMEDGLLRVPSAYGGEQIITRALIEDGRNHLLLGAPIGITCPIRLLHGQRDPDVPWHTALQVAERLEGADVQVTLVKDGAHRLSRAGDLALIRALAKGLLGK